MFVWTYKDLKGKILELVQHIIELDISIPPTHQTRYNLNPNYATTIKQDIDNVIHLTNRRGYMVVTPSGSALKEWTFENMCGFQKVE